VLRSNVSIAKAIKERHENFSRDRRFATAYFKKYYRNKIILF
jgi:hypothetical protein